MHAAASTLEVTFLLLQSFVVVFLIFHDLIPLGRLNNSAAKQNEDSFLHLLWTTAVSAVPAAIGLFYSARYFARPYPHWLAMFLWIMYGLFIFGMLRAWWIPYLFVPDAKRAERYQSIFANTHAFLPVRNGIVPDTLHVTLHLVVAATMVALFLRERLYP